jgi:hypothetical protein
MITTRKAPRTGRLLAGAFVLSVLIHLFGGALWAHTTRLIARIMHRLPEQHQREEEVATSDVVRLERRTIPRPAQASRARPRPLPLVRPQPPQPHAIRVAAAVQPIPRPRPSAHARPQASAAPQLAHVVKHAPPRIRKPQVATVTNAGASAATPRKAVLSAERLAALNAQFSATIAASHVDLATIQRQAEARPVAIKRYPMQFTGMQASLQRGEGYIEPTTTGQRIGGTVWYYTHYTYMWPDGHLEDDDIPWPFHFPVQRDLFALHIHLIPLQLPPPGFRITRPLKPFLSHFVQSAGQG